MDALAVRAHLVRALEADLIGPFRDDEILHQRPGRWYLTGFLVPYGAPMGALEHQWAEEEFADEEVATNGPAEGGDDDGDGDGRRAAQPPRLPSSFGLTVLVPAAATTLGVSLRWGQYHVESRETPEAAAEGEAKPERRESWWQRVPVEVPEWPVPVESGLHPVPGHADLWLMVRVRPAPEAGAQVVSVFLSNRAKKGGTATHDTRALFQAQMKLHCAPGFVPRTSRVHEASDDLDQRRADLQYRNHAEWGVGHGVAAAMEDDGRVVSTSWLPRATVSRMKASGGYGVTLDMEALAAMPDAATLQADLAQLLPAYLAWMEGQRAEGVALGGDRADIAQVMMDEAARAHARIAEGIALLGDDAVFRAFRFTCDAMARSARKARPGEAPTWRLFQLAFLLLNLPGLADSGHDDRTTVELLFFPTGGGKTEAYLGVATFAQVLRRLRHRTALHQGAGVAVLLRYTLRLLTLDQLQRAATLTCALELIRRENPGILGEHRFSIGLWVGNKATPNTLKDARDQHASHRANPGDPRKPLPCPLTFCPWCGTPFSHESLRFEGSAQNPTAMHLECREKTLTCPFGPEYGAVPLEWVDEQIYRRLPGFLVGTVDKFALLPWRGEAGALFGKVWGKGQGGYVPASQKPASGGSGALPGGLPPPELIIQDELHLITGPLGTLVGLYEAAIDGLCRDAQGHGPKIVASTATARRAGEQIKGLFGRGDTALFPPPGVNAGDMFFAQTDEAPEKTRLYVGVGAPGRNQKALMVRVYSTLLSAAYRCWQVSPKSADAFNSLVAYFNTLRELGGAARLVREEVAPRAGLLEIRRAVQDADGGLFRKRELGLDVYELTSRLTTDQIRKAKDRFAAAYKSEVGGRNDVLLASSMISVGVDIPRLGLMVMNGQPRTVAEYIQATSRVGRETPGLVVTLHNLYRPRDRSHYERFTAFHEAFYRDVEAASVTPFSPRAVDRGLAGALVALARHRWPTLSPSVGSGKVDAVAGLKESLVQVFKERAALGEGAKHEATTLEDWLAGRVVSLVSDWSTLVNGLLQKGVQVHYSPWETQGRALLRPLDAAPDVHHPLFDHFRAPTSMRDVEPEVDVWLNKAPGEGGMGKPAGGIRRSQLLTGYGPGALLDLLDSAVIVGGLDQWRYLDENGGFLTEVRLQSKAQALLVKRGWSHGAVRLRLPPECDDENPNPKAGIGVREFPRWFLCQNDRCRSLVHRTGLDERGRHACTHDQKKPFSAVPFRFIGACPHGHVQDLNWLGYVHKDHPAVDGVYCKPQGTSMRPNDPLGDLYTSPLYLNVVGTSGELTDFVLGCRDCGATRGLQELIAPLAMGKCKGRRPWLGSEGQQTCPEPDRLKVVTRTQSNLYFPEVLSVLSIPDPGLTVREVVDKAWDFLSAVEEIGDLKFVRKQPVPKALLADMSDEVVWTEVQRRQKGLPAPVPPTRETEWRALYQAEVAKPGEGPPRGERWWPRRAQLELPPFLERVVLVHSLAEVRAQIGFTRIDVQAPDAEGDFGESVSSARLGLLQNWVPAVEIFGEGIFLGFNIQAVRAWETLPAVVEQGKHFTQGYLKHNQRYGSEMKFPGTRLVMLHSLAHLLIQAISLECGYPATAIRERLYCHASADPEKERAGILLYTGTPGSEGTLGGLVKVGLDIVRHLRRAAELGRLCSNDPVCAQHLPDSEEDRLRSGAACHGCVLIGEPSCERMNQDLDRTLVVPTVEQPDAAFLGPWMATWS